MSPEQARGKPVDKRADIWAFGVVLFEMLAGQRLFDGETVSDVLAAVLAREIDWSRLPAETPPAVRHVLERCLERDPRQRLRDIADARHDLEGPGAAAASATDGRGDRAPGPRPPDRPADGRDRPRRRRARRRGRVLAERAGAPKPHGLLRCPRRRAPA